MVTTPHFLEEPRHIERYGDNGFVVDGASYHHALLITPAHCLEWDLAEGMTAASLSALLEEAGTINILIVGTGAMAQILPPEITALLRAAGIIPEVMSTGAACRTYNILRSEGRAVATALMLP